MKSKQRESEVFSQAIRLPEQERTAFIQSACGQDAALAGRILELVASHESPDSFLQPETADYSKSDAVGTTVDKYKLLQELGEGGMGTVYMAEQLRPVKRRVAVKIIKAGMDSKQFIARFEAERQALAMMDHPNIAQVLDGGTTDAGRPYFVMELVKGISITSFCDENKLNLQERLELFIPVCQAVQHAHQKGIIHRDLKPSNVLVAMYDDRPVPKVIDFGVAKATNQQLTDKTLFTMVGQIFGTLEYMSPEQAVLNQLDVDTRSDVYSLGVILYELLTGVTPIDGERLRSAALEETLRIIREVDPLKPSTRVSSLGTTNASPAYRKTNPQKLADGLRGDLDWIVMKALDKDRKRRYETANDLGAELGRFMSNEPIEARPPSAAYQFRKFVRRNRLLVGIVAAVLVTLIGGLVASTQVALAFRQKNQQIEESLGHVKDYTMMMALSGDPEQEQQAIDIATPLVGADSPWIDLLRSNSAFWRGDRKRSISILRNKYEQSDDIPCRAWLSLSHLASGDTEPWIRLQKQLERADPKTPEDYTFLAIANIHTPDHAISLIEKAREIRDSLAARHIHGVLLSRRSMDRSSIEDARAAVSLLKDIRKNSRENATIVLETFIANTGLAYILKKKGDIGNEYTAVMDSLAVDRKVLESLPFFSQRQNALCWNLECLGSREEADGAWRTALEHGAHGSHRFHAASMLIANDDEQLARETLTGDELLERISLATVLAAKKKNQEEVLQIYWELSKRDVLTMFWGGAPIEVLAFQSDRKLQRTEANRLLKQDKFYQPFDRVAVEFLADIRTPKEVIEAAGVGHRNLANAHCLVGTSLLSDGRIDDAVKHFEAAADTTAIDLGQFYWPRAFLRRIRERPESIDWLDIPQHAEVASD